MVYKLTFKAHIIVNAVILNFTKYYTDGMKVNNKTQNSVAKINIQNLPSQVALVMPEALVIIRHCKMGLLSCITKNYE